MGLLSLSIWVPIAFGALLLLFGREGQANLVRWLALIGSLVGAVIVTAGWYWYRSRRSA